MTTDNDILFLQQFREKIAQYLFLGCSPPEIFTYNESKGLDKMKLDLERQRKMKEAMKNQEFQAKKQEIEGLRDRAQKILAKCGVTCILTQYPLSTMGGPVLRFNLLDLITENKTRSTLSLKTFTDKIDEAVKLLTETKNGESAKNGHESEKQPETSAGRLYIAVPAGIQDTSQQVIYNAIDKVAKKMGLAVLPSESLAETEQITDKTLNTIQAADFLVADISTYRPQVYFQAGYGQALGKKIIYLVRKNIPIKIDIQTNQPIVYTNTQELAARLTDRLTALAAAIKKLN